MSDEIAPPVFVRAAEGEWEVVDRATDDAIGAAYATRNEALDAALAELGGADVLKTPHLKDEKTGALCGAWRWLDATSEEDEADVLDEDGELMRPRITAEAIDSMAALLNASPMPRPIDGGKVPSDFAPSEVHGSYADSGTPANGWAHAGVPFVNEKGRTHLALRAELLPTVAREFDRGRIAYGSVHVEGDSMDETGAISGASLESHALTNRPVVQRLIPSTAMQSAGRRAVVTLRGKHMPKSKVITLRGPALSALTSLCEIVGLTLDDEMETMDSYMSPLVDRVRSLKTIAVGEQVLESLPAGGGDAAAAVTAAYALHQKAIATKLAEEGGAAAPGTGEGAAATTEGDASTKVIDALQKAIGATTPDEVLTFVEAHADEIGALVESDTAAEGTATEDATITASKARKGGTALERVLLSKVERIEAAEKARAEKDAEAEKARFSKECADLVEAAIVAGKIPTHERAEYVELASTNRELFVKLTKDARYVPTGDVAQRNEVKGKNGKTAAQPVTEAELDEEERVHFDAILAAGILKDRAVIATKARAAVAGVRERA